MPVQKWVYLKQSHFPTMLANTSVSGDPACLEGQKITTINITQGRSGRKSNHRNATICRNSHKTGPTKQIPKESDALGQLKSSQRSARSKQKEKTTWDMFILPGFPSRAGTP